MQKKVWLSGLALAGIVGAALSTAALADREGMHRPMGHSMGMGGMMGGPGGMMGGPDGGPPFDFAAIDANGDGKITKEEFDAWRKAEAATLDTNGDGKIDKAEMKAAILRKMEAQADRMVNGFFDERDSDGDGFLTAAEMVVPPVPAHLFDRVDANGDGAVTQDEVDAMRARMRDHMGEGRGDRMGQHGPRKPFHGQGQGQDDGQDETGN